LPLDEHDLLKCSHEKSGTHMTCLLDLDIWLTPIDECCHGFSASKLLAASSLHVVKLG